MIQILSVRQFAYSEAFCSYKGKVFVRRADKITQAIEWLEVIDNGKRVDINIPAYDAELEQAIQEVLP